MNKMIRNILTTMSLITSLISSVNADTSSLTINNFKNDSDYLMIVINGANGETKVIPSKSQIDDKQPFTIKFSNVPMFTPFMKIIFSKGKETISFNASKDILSNNKRVIRFDNHTLRLNNGKNGGMDVFELVSDNNNIINLFEVGTQIKDTSYNQIIFSATVSGTK